MIKFEKVTKKFGNGILALENIDLEIADEEFIFITGPSGAGKTTLLRLLIRDLLPTTGSIFINDWNVGKIPSYKIPHLRRKIGMVFQNFKLLYERTVFENVALALEIIGKKNNEITPRVQEVLELVDLEKQKNLFPIQLSGGELQRTVLARALVTNPDILLADEPTGNLDPATSWGIIKLLEEINKMKTTVIMATHNVDIVNSLGKRVVALEGGRLLRDEKEGKYGKT